MSASEFQKKKFYVPLNLSEQGRKNYINIDWTDYCKCKEPYFTCLRISASGEKTFGCGDCGKPVKR